MGKIRAVIFDMDGLMVDTERMTSVFRRQALAELGIPYRDLLSLVMGRNDQEVRAIYLEQYGPDYPYDQVRVRVRQLWTEYLQDNPVPAKPGLYQLLEYL